MIELMTSCKTRKVLTDNRGTILVMTAFLVIVLAVLFAGVVEFGRFLILKEKTQTASDAAAVAASSSAVEKWVKINVSTDRGDETVCVCDDTGCDCWCEWCGITSRTVTGTERELIDHGGWRDYCVPFCDCTDGDCWFEIKDRWVTYGTSRASSYQIADLFYQANAPEESYDSWINRMRVHASKNCPYYPSVTVYGKSSILSMFSGLLPYYYTTETCSQGITFYRDPKTQEGMHYGPVTGQGKWIKPPPDACWRD